jgi:hypothetical protein
MDEEQQVKFLGQLAEDLAQGGYPGSSIAHLLSLHLEDLPEWRWRWIDDVLDVRIEVEGDRVEVLGYAVWGKDGETTQWTDPLRAVFTSDAERKIVGYELQFCDPERASQPGSQPRKHQPTADLNWSYSFVWP